MLRAGFRSRSVWGIVAAAVMGAASLATGGPAGAQDTETGEGIIPPGMDFTDEQVEELIGLYEEAVEVLPEEYPATADSEPELAAILGEIGGTGYYNFGATAPGGWVHYINPGYVVDDIMVDPYHVESLVYHQDSDGSLELVSAMYMAPPGMYHEDLPEDVAWYPGWHGHPELCTSSDGTFGGITDPDDPDCPEGTSQALTPLMFHVWIAEENPCDHVFGGIGIGGVHCDHDHHDDHDDPGHDDGHDDDDPDHDDHDDHDDGHDDGHDDDGHDDHGDDDHGDHGDDDGHDDDHDHITPPAPAVNGEPILTG